MFSATRSGVHAAQIAFTLLCKIVYSTMSFALTRKNLSDEYFFPLTIYHEFHPFPSAFCPVSLLIVSHVRFAIDSICRHSTPSIKMYDTTSHHSRQRSLISSAATSINSHAAFDAASEWPEGFDLAAGSPQKRHVSMKVPRCTSFSLSALPTDQEKHFEVTSPLKTEWKAPLIEHDAGYESDQENDAGCCACLSS